MLRTAIASIVTILGALAATTASAQWTYPANYGYQAGGYPAATYPAYNNSSYYAPSAAYPGYSNCATGNCYSYTQPASSYYVPAYGAAYSANYGANYGQSYGQNYGQNYGAAYGANYGANYGYGASCPNGNCQRAYPANYPANYSSYYAPAMTYPGYSNGQTGSFYQQPVYPAYGPAYPIGGSNAPVYSLPSATTDVPVPRSTTSSYGPSFQTKDSRDQGYRTPSYDQPNLRTGSGTPAKNASHTGRNPFYE